MNSDNFLEYYITVRIEEFAKELIAELLEKANFVQEVPLTEQDQKILHAISVYSLMATVSTESMHNLALPLEALATSKINDPNAPEDLKNLLKQVLDIKMSNSKSFADFVSRNAGSDDEGPVN